MSSHDDENPSTPWERNFREQMKRLREARGMTQTDVAKLVRAFSNGGMTFHQQTVQRIERGDRPVRLDEAFVIAKVLEVDLDSMTAQATPAARALRYAVGTFRHRSEEVAEEIARSIFDWLAVAAEQVVFAVYDRLESVGDEELDDGTAWGMAWAFKALDAYNDLCDGHYQLACGIAAGGDDVPIAVDVMKQVARWRENDAYDAVRDLAALDPEDLDKRMPASLRDDAGLVEGEG